MIKEIIKNRKNQKMAVMLEEAKNQKGLVFVMHGLGGFKEQPHIEAMANAFKENNYTVVRFDTTNTLGESDGEFEKATVGNYYEDLQDVIKWASAKSWHEEPFCLAGHSLGGMCVALFAENYSEKIKGLALISTVVSGKLSAQVKLEERKEWEKTGWLIKESKSKPGVIKKLPWSHMIDRQKYDLLEKVNKLTMPVLLIVGEKDDTTPPEHQKILYDALLGNKELHIVKNADHNFREKIEKQELKNIFIDWIRNQLD